MNQKKNVKQLPHWVKNTTHTQICNVGQIILRHTSITAASPKIWPYCLNFRA